MFRVDQIIVWLCVVTSVIGTQSSEHFS